MKVARNEPCPCGSGKKYKKCCLEKDETAVLEERNKALAQHDQERESREADEPQWGKHTSDPFQSDHEYLAQNSYPAISDEENSIVDEWWEEYKAMEDTDIIREHLESFMQTHPNLVESLELDSEVLFELGAAYRREDRFGEHISLLLKIREQFPETYVRSAGYYDSDIIAWLVSKGRIDDISQYFNHFVDHPIDFVEQVFDVCNLLMAIDATEPLLSLVSRIHDLITSSSEIISGDEILLPLVYQKLSTHIKAGYSERDIECFVQELKEEMQPAADIEELKEHWEQRFANIMRPYTPWTDKLPQKKSQQNELYFNITDHFMRYLHDEYGLSWISAQFHSRQVYDYTREYMDQKPNKRRKMFDFSMDRIDTISAKIAQREFFFLDSTTLISLLNAIFYFAEYLLVCSMIDEGKKQQIQENARKMYEKIYPRLKEMNVEAYCFPQFPFWG